MSNKLIEFTQSLNSRNIDDLIAAVTKSGNVTTEILNYINGEIFDVVIMGVNGNGGLNMEMGKNARKIEENSSVLVQLVLNKLSS